MADIISIKIPLLYSDGIKLMEERRDLIERKGASDCFYILEHKSVYTLGRHGAAENIITDNHIPVYQADRGGDITYHGPGQIVVYPVINIKKAGLGIKEYIHRLEQLVINTLLLYGVKSERNKINHGVWIGNSKIASVGVRVRNGVTTHGIAVNINTDLEPFSWIKPCGLSDVAITSLWEITGVKHDVKEVKKSMESEIRRLFGECFSD